MIHLMYDHALSLLFSLLGMGSEKGKGKKKGFTSTLSFLMCRRRSAGLIVSSHPF